MGKKNKLSLKELISKATEHSTCISVCTEIFKLMEVQDQEARTETFRWFVEEATAEWRQEKEPKDNSEITELLKRLSASNHDEEDIQNEQKETYISNLEIALFNTKYQPVIEGIINMIAVEGNSSHIFYNKLFNKLSELCRGKTEKEKGLCLYNVVWDKRIPYFEVKAGIILPDEEFKDIVDSLTPQIRKMVFILNSSHSQRTEEASQLLDVIDELKTSKKKAVLLAQLLKIARKEHD